jgi:hypothetical protein
MKCQLGHIYSGGSCPFCEHLQAEWDDECRQESIDAGDEEHGVLTPINDKTTEQKGAIIL